jgi:hypothetical protein
MIDRFSMKQTPSIALHYRLKSRIAALRRDNARRS